MTTGPKFRALLDFNAENAGKQEEITKQAQKNKEEVDSDSSGFESEMGDSQCEEYVSSDEEMKEDSGNADPDAFEEVKTTGRRRNR